MLVKTTLINKYNFNLTALNCHTKLCCSAITNPLSVQIIWTLNLLWQGWNHFCSYFANHLFRIHTSVECINVHKCIYQAQITENEPIIWFEIHLDIQIRESYGSWDWFYCLISGHKLVPCCVIVMLLKINWNLPSFPTVWRDQGLWL